MANKTEYGMVQKHKTYAEYLAESRAHPITQHIAPVIAHPKYSKGDTPIERTRQTETHRRGLISIDELGMNKNGTINTRKLKSLKRKIYKAQEQGHGR